MTGTGVFLFNTYSIFPSDLHGATASCGQLDLAGNGTMTLSAMTTGPWRNLLVYQDVNCSGPDNSVVIEGNGSFTGTGSFYVPTAPFVFNGNNATLILDRGGWEVIEEHRSKNKVAKPLVKASDSGIDLHMQNFVDVVKSFLDWFNKK